MDTIMSNASFSHIYYFILIPIGLIAYFAFAIFKTKNEKQRVTNWLNEHPNAVKVYIGKTSSVTGYNDLRCEQTGNNRRKFKIV